MKNKSRIIVHLNIILILELQKYLLFFNSICCFHFHNEKNQKELWAANISSVLEQIYFMCSSNVEIFATWSVFFHVLGFPLCSWKYFWLCSNISPNGLWTMSAANRLMWVKKCLSLSWKFSKNKQKWKSSIFSH